MHFFISFNTGHCGSTVLGNTHNYYGSSTGEKNASTVMLAEGGDDGGAADAGHDGDITTSSSCRRASTRACEGDLVGMREVEHRDSPCVATFEYFAGTILLFGQRFPRPAQALAFGAFESAQPHSLRPLNGSRYRPYTLPTRRPTVGS